MNPVDRQWRVAYVYGNPQDAICMRARLIKAGKRARIKAYKATTTPIKPANNTEARRAREAAAEQMSDRADANKKYKSPG